MSRGAASKTSKHSVIAPRIIGVTGREMKMLGEKKVKSERIAPLHEFIVAPKSMWTLNPS